MNKVIAINRINSIDDGELKISITHNYRVKLTVYCYILNIICHKIILRICKYKRIIVANLLKLRVNCFTVMLSIIL